MEKLKSTIFYFDAQNLYRRAKKVFSVTYPNFDPIALSNLIAQKHFLQIKNHINGIENFWGIAKVKLYKFRGMDKRTFYLHLKECEFRFNHRQDNLYKLLLKIIKNKPLKLS